MENVAPPSPGEDSRPPYAALRFGEYRLYVLGNTAINVGSNMQIRRRRGWELYERTHSALALGWVGLAQAVPIMLLAIPSGQLADRMDRRRIILMGQLIMAACSVGLAIASYSRGPVEWMYAMLVLGAIGRAALWPGWGCCCCRSWFLLAHSAAPSPGGPSIPGSPPWPARRLAGS